ncbi:ScyD/ScyE family protein [Nocardioides dubius]|uniref:ScyD/ScyE family protein n=1 Tax=Nocardioides dubius TaxID=317019 RepID=A0ABN1TPJ7_9ACTN
MKSIRLSATLSALALGASLGAAPTALADSESAPAPDWHVVATGLDNPRHLSVNGNALYVAEAGTGGSGPCQAGPEGDEVCFGKTGAITRVTWHGQRRVVTGLPSLASPDGSAAIGPTDVLAHGRSWVATIGLGADPAVRDQLPATGRRLLGTVATGKWWKKKHHRGWSTRPRVLADLAGYEAANDPDGVGPDSNPGGIARTRGGFVVADAGANAVLKVSAKGRIKLIGVLDSPGTAPAPFPPFPEIEMQAVPTSVFAAPDGSVYVSELVGFPFQAGAARIHRFSRTGAHSIVATGLTNVTDLAWYRGSLYAVQIADEGLLAAGEELPMGSLVKVVPGGTATTVVDNLPAPYGVAFARGTAFLTTCAVCPDGGQVVAADLTAD